MAKRQPKAPATKPAPSTPSRKQPAKLSAGDNLSHILEPMRAYAIPVSKIKPDPDNPRVHPAAQLRRLADSLSQHGQVKPLLISKSTGYLVTGHGTLEAATNPDYGLNWSHLAAFVLEGDELRMAALALADNQTSAGAKWDPNKLEKVIKRFGGRATLEKFATGFTPSSLQAALGRRVSSERNETNDDDLPDTPDDAPIVSEPGDLWVLGRHRLLVGDCTDAESVDRLMDGQHAAMVYFDPPYAVSLKSRGANTRQYADEFDASSYTRLITKALDNAQRHASANAAYYVWHADLQYDLVRAATVAAGLRVLQMLIWGKVFGAGTKNQHYKQAHEPILYCVAGDDLPPFYGMTDEPTVWHIAAVGSTGERTHTLEGGLLITTPDGHDLWCNTAPPIGRRVRRVVLEPGQSLSLGANDPRSSLWEIKRDAPQNYQHPAQKPVEVPRRAIFNSTKTGQVILEPCGGSGSTIIAAEREGRRCFALELEPRFADLIVRRWQKITNETATRTSKEGAPKEGIQ